MTPDEILREWNEKNNAKVKTTVTEIAHKDASAENAQLIKNASKKEMENDMPNRIIANETPEQHRLRELEEEIARLRAAIHVQQNNQNAAAGGGASYFDRYVQKECKSEEEKEALREDVDSFWSRLAGYQNDENGHRAYGLAVGRVQSGKLYYHKRGNEDNNREYLERSKLYCKEAIPLLRAMLERNTHVQRVERMLREMEARGFEEARHCLAEMSNKW